jgi:hypothetical protein
MRSPGTIAPPQRVQSPGYRAVMIFVVGLQYKKAARISSGGVKGTMYRQN